MSNLGKDSGTEKAQKSYEELIKEFTITTNKISDLKAKNPDRSAIKEEVKASFRNYYVKAAQLAQAISERTTDSKEREDYKIYHSKLSDEATLYGSVIKGKIPKTTFDDVKGLDEVKNLVKSFMFMAKREDLVKYYKLEGGLGMLMYGPPGTGKTMFAEAISNAMRLPLFIVTPADIYKSYVGESEQAVKQIFQEMDACTDGAILFVDECESIFSKRTQDTKDYKSAVTTELLQRMNGFGVNGAKRIMIAATTVPTRLIQLT
jgi:SpoVK/Ycf46/Vps4 family AAA+-type ATPase